MKGIKSLFFALLLVAGVACKHPVEEQKKLYPELTSIEDTMWYSHDAREVIYYDIYYYADAGVMLGYDTPQRENEVVRRPFTYTFTPATDDIDAIVSLHFEDGQMYGGILVPKGNLQISNKDVYIIQLYECDDKGYIIYDDAGNIKSTIMMWRE